MERPLKILLMGDASNYHNSLAKALRAMGHDVTVASNGSHWMDTPRDIDISRRRGRVSGLALWLKTMGLGLSRLRGYDIVELSGPIFIDLKPVRVRQIFDLLRRHNHHIYMSAIATDTPYVDECLNQSSPIVYNDWVVNGHPSPYALRSPEILQAWRSAPLRPHCDYIYHNVEGVVSALYEYHVAAARVVSKGKLAYGGIPIDTTAIKPVELPGDITRVKLFLGMHSARKVEKGTDIIQHAAAKLAEEYPERCSLEIVENLPYDQYLERMRGSHVVLDQIYSYTPATNALLAMAMGLATLSGGEEMFYDFIGEKRLRPVIASPVDYEGVYTTLKDVIMNPAQLARRSREGREFVVRHNDSRVVASRFINFWMKDIKVPGSEA
jgi:hypothetical protein